MGRICRVIASGRVLEYQSAASPGTLIENAVGSGFARNLVEEAEVIQAEWDAIRATILAEEATARPDRRGFEEALKAIFPDDLLTLRRVLILFWLVEHEEWPRLKKAILAAKAAGEITSGSPTAQYEQIKDAAVAKRIPVTLP